nr:serine/threonine protein kinase SRPK1 [Tanacetum cinerariifolium]
MHILHDVEYDRLYDFLKQNKVNVNASRAKRAAKAHDPVTLVAKTYTSPSHSRSSPAYYVTHPPSDEELEELNTLCIMMARIQEITNDSVAEPSYESEFIDGVQAPSFSFLKELFTKSDHEQSHHEKHKTIKPTYDDDEIDSNIILDDPDEGINIDNVRQDNHAHDQQCDELEKLLRNVQIESANTQRKIGSDCVAITLDAVGPPILPKASFEPVAVTASQVVVTSLLVTSDGVTIDSDAVSTYNYSSNNHVRKFLRALLLKWRFKVTTFEEAKDLATLSSDELISNLKVYEIILENDGVAFKTTKEKVKSLGLKVIRFFRKGNDPDMAIDSKTRLIGLEEAAEIALGTKEVKSLNKGEVVIIARKKATSLVSVQSAKRTRILTEDLTCLIAI